MSTNLRSIQAGEPGLVRVLARAGLRALSGAFAAAVALRGGAYAAGLVRPRRLPVPVLSVGNLVAGGTGKTPFVAWLVGRLEAAGRRPGVLARGYGPHPPGFDVSDEGVLLRRLLGARVPYVEDPDRRRGGANLLAAHPSTDVLVLDDGFQHWRVARDLDLVLLDATNPFGYGHLLPRGLLREGPRALRRAGGVVLTRAERVPEATRTALIAGIRRFTDAPTAVAVTRPVAVEVGGQHLPAEALRGRRVHACSGIGNPDAFVATLRDLGAEVVGRSDFADHALLSERDLGTVADAAKAQGAEWVVLTRKDAVKRLRLPADTVVLDVETEVVEGESALCAAVEAALSAGGLRPAP